MNPLCALTALSLFLGLEHLPILTVPLGATDLIGMQLWLRSISLHTPWPARSRRT